ncbi:MAG TPA: hypothetical protein PKJ51_10055 [Methanothrix sp.]|jgi:hypothetical protein|nr:hypothetical protein [Methanothrix sp.]
MTPPRYSIHVRRSTPSHVYFGLFVNGSLAGEIILRLEEFEDFERRLGNPRACSAEDGCFAGRLGNG